MTHDRDKGQSGTKSILSPKSSERLEHGPGVGLDARQGGEGAADSGTDGTKPFRVVPLSPCRPASVPPTVQGSSVTSIPRVESRGTDGERDKINSVPCPSRNSDLRGEGGRDQPLKGVGPVARAGRPSTRFLSLDEAALFDERAAIREHDGELPRAAAERLAWLDVLAARQIAAGVLNALREAS